MHSTNLRSRLKYALGQLSAADELLGQLGLVTFGSIWYVNPGTDSVSGLAKGSDENEGSMDDPLATIAEAHTRAVDGDVIALAPGSYVEAVTITKDVVLIGLGPRGSVAVAPGTANGIALTIEGTAAARTQDVTLINVGGEGDGTGGGLHVKGNIRRIRAVGCKFEGGAFAAKFESTAAGSVGDVIFYDVEFAWSTDGVHLTASGGGDPVTNVRFARCWWHNITTSYVKNSVAHSTNVVIDDPVFDNAEDGTEPTKAIDLAVASTTGVLINPNFPTATLDSAKVALATGVDILGWRTQQEGAPATGGTSGRPD